MSVTTAETSRVVREALLALAEEAHKYGGPSVRPSLRDVALHAPDALLARLARLLR